MAVAVCGDTQVELSARAVISEQCGPANRALAPQGSFAGTWTIDHNDTTNTAIEIGSGFAGDAPGSFAPAGNRGP